MNYPLQRNDQNKIKYNTVLKIVFFLWQHTNVSYYCGSNETSHYENICLTVNDIKNNNVIIKLQHTWIHNSEAWLNYPKKLQIQLVNIGKYILTLYCAINAKQAINFIPSTYTYFSGLCCLKIWFTKSYTSQFPKVSDVFSAFLTSNECAHSFKQGSYIQRSRA